MDNSYGNEATGFVLEHGSSVTARCEDCNEPLCKQRLEAVPNTKRCVPCTTLAGDVPKIKRFDDSYGDELYETYYYKNQYFDGYLERIAQGNFSETISY